MDAAVHGWVLWHIQQNGMPGCWVIGPNTVLLQVDRGPSDTPTDRPPIQEIIGERFAGELPPPLQEPFRRWQCDRSIGAARQLEQAFGEWLLPQLGTEVLW